MIRLPLAHKIAASVLPTVLVTVLGLGLWTYRTAYETARERIHVALGYVADRYLHDRVETIWAHRPRLDASGMWTDNPARRGCVTSGGMAQT